MTILKNGFVINPASFYLPAYRISPFRKEFNSVNRAIIDGGSIDTEIIKAYFGECFFPTMSGRIAIAIALRQFDLEPSDEVAIFTTSGNRYISSCVTGEIEQVCKWSMEITPSTRLILVNHEFGYCYRNLAELKKYGLPIIEDMAFSFASSDLKNEAGRTGDFVIYSLPKFFPVSFGGVLKCNNAAAIRDIPVTEKTLTRYFNILMSAYLPKVEQIKNDRLANFDYLSEIFSRGGLHPYFDKGPFENPGVFLFRIKDIDLPAFKIFMQANGIESSVFYGEDAFYIPVHQDLNRDDMDFFYFLTSYFIENGNK